MPIPSRTVAALLVCGLLLVPGATVLTGQPGPVVVNVTIWDGRGTMDRDAMLEIVEDGAPGRRAGGVVPVLADWPTEARRDHRANTASVRTPPLEIGVRYLMRYWPRSARGDGIEVPLAVTAAMCPGGCERDAVALELERDGRTLARGTPVLAATGSRGVGANVVPGPFNPRTQTRR